MRPASVGATDLAILARVIYVIDLSHDPRGHVASLPRSAEILWETFTSIAECASASWRALEPRTTALACRRRPKNRPCPGYVEILSATNEQVQWECPACADGGVVTGWRGTASDLSEIQVPGEVGTDWCAALVTPQEYRALLAPEWKLPGMVRRILRAARATRPGIRIEAPRPGFVALVHATASTVAGLERRTARRLLKSAWLRFVDATEVWE